MGTRKQMEQALRRVLTGEGLSRPDYSIVIPVIWTQDGPELLIEVDGGHRVVKYIPGGEDWTF